LRLAARIRARLAAPWTARFRDVAAREQDRLGLWLPVCFGAGIATYLSLTSEPTAWPAPLIALLLVSFAWLGRRNLLALTVTLGVAGVALGFAAADWRTARVAAPVLTSEIRAADIEGLLLQKSFRADGGVRLLIAPTHISRLDPADRPARIRLNVRTSMDAIAPGDHVALRAGLMPPPGPAAPGAFDFGRQAYFRQIGAVGYAIAPVRLVTPFSEMDGGWTACLRFCVARLRHDLTMRIIDALPPPRGAIAAALMTGDRGGIPEEILQDLRDTGLAHLLAISGLHMALFAGALFWGVRALLALSPRLALTRPIKKWAAGAALAGAFGYLLVSGASVATQRAFVMFTLIFVAVMLDRPAITMRNVALAAMIVLLLTPEAVMEAGFQMSFAAAIALVAFYEWARPWLSDWNRRMADRGVSARFWLYLGGVALTTIVASTATAPFAAYHFNRVVDFGLVANLAAVPVVGLIVMPAALMSFVAMPFGLEALPLWVAGQGIVLIVSVADIVASWPGAVTPVPAMPPMALACLVLGGLWMALWRTRVRWAGIAGPALGILLAVNAPYPDGLVSRDGDLVAVRGGDGLLAFSSARGAGFTADAWLRRDADLRSQREAAGGVFTCDADGCIATGTDLGLVAVPRTWRGLVEDCAVATLVVTDMYAPDRCSAPLLIDRRRLARQGAVALYADAAALGGVRVVTACSVSGERPWTRCR